MSTLRLRRPLSRALRDGHPWVYREALEGEADVGAFVSLLDERGQAVGRGVADGGPIGLRLWTLRSEELDTLLRDRIGSAFALRAALASAETSAVRLLHGEGDRCPGIVVDEYGCSDGRFAVLRLDGDGVRANLERIVDALRPALDARCVRGLLMRRPRGDDERTEQIYGDAPPDPVVVHEHGMSLVASLLHGQKTGLFLDHRESRRLVRTLAAGRRVLNLYAYTGGFSVGAGLGGALRVTSVDIASPALELAERSWAANGLPRDGHRTVARDASAFLAAESASYDLIIADPPSFAPRADAVPTALTSYRKLHEACIERLARDGLYLAASCSSHVDAAAFEGTLLEAARRSRRVVQVLARFGAPMDHPRLLAFPEGDYLKVILCRAMDR